MTEESLNLVLRAPVSRANEQGSLDYLELAKQRAPDPSAFDGRDIAFWTAEISSNALDYYFTRMHERSLQNYADQLNRGVSFQDSHEIRKNGWGQSIHGELIRHQEKQGDFPEDKVTVNGTFFTARDLSLGGQSTNDFIDAMRMGIWRDVSVGISCNDVECGICNEQVLSGMFGDGDCLHVPGMQYEDRVAWAWINDGELNEVSQVYDGATPNAAIIKAELLAAEGLLSPAEQFKVEQRYATRIRTERRFPSQTTGGWQSQRTKGTNVAVLKKLGDHTKSNLRFEKLEAEDADAVVAKFDDGTEVTVGALIDFLAEHEAEGTFDAEEVENYTPEEQVLMDEAIADVKDIAREPALAMAKRLKELRLKESELTNKVQTFEKEASDGRQYRKDLVEETLACGVRAMGDKFRADMYRAQLEKADIAFIKTVKEDFEATGDAKLRGSGSGFGRQTRDTGTTPPATGEGRRFNAAAHKS